MACDPAYDSFVQWMLETDEHKRLSILPKICSRIDLAPRKTSYGRLHSYKMERLTPLPSLYNERFNVRGTRYSWDDVTRAMENAVYHTRSRNRDIHEVLADCVDGNGPLSTVLRAGEIRDFKRLLCAVHEGDVMHNWYIDIHAGNLCLRNDGSIVIVDPLS